jgi:hypothetical protein
MAASAASALAWRAAMPLESVEVAGEQGADLDLDGRRRCALPCRRDQALMTQSVWKLARDTPCSTMVSPLPVRVMTVSPPAALMV